ncbi:hypothetical protein Ancab_002533 [Ancistrocladus abbreviatus]
MCRRHWEPINRQMTSDRGIAAAEARHNSGRQLRLDYLIATYKKPVVALIHGLVMGGGAGLSMNAPFRIVTEKTVFAMPEASFGLFSDVGASYFLSRLPCSIGEYLGLTGKRFNGSEMLACGLATHFVLSKDLPLLEKELDEAGSAASVIRKVVDRYAHKPNVKEDSPLMRVDLVNKCFSKNTVEEILQSLEKGDKATMSKKKCGKPPKKLTDPMKMPLVAPMALSTPKLSEEAARVVLQDESGLKSAASSQSNWAKEVEHNVKE